MKIVSKLHEKCENCPYVNDCGEKRMVACRMMERPEKMFNSASASMTMLIAAEMLVKHDYRDIKISPTQTITIDLEEQKRQLERDIYKALGGPCLEFGA